MSNENGAVEAHQWDTARKRMGAVSELRASAHLLAQGYDVYRSVADRAAFDLVAHRDGQLIRVEVKTLSRPKLDHYCPAFGWPVNDEWDLLLIVGPDVVMQFWAASGVTRLDAVRSVRKHYGLEVATEPTQRQRVRALLEEHPEREWTAPEVAEVLDLPRSHVTGAFKALDGADAIVRVRHGVFRGSDRPGASEPGSLVSVGHRAHFGQRRGQPAGRTTRFRGNVALSAARLRAEPGRRARPARKLAPQHRDPRERYTVSAEASNVVELAAAWLVVVTFLVAWRLEGLFDRVDVLERLAHPPANRGRCPKCGDRLVTASQPKEATDART